MKRSLVSTLALLSISLSTARPAVIYSGLQNVGIPTGFTGIYLDVDGGTTGTDDNAPPAGWDINAFYGGAGVAWSPVFQPARIGPGSTDSILGLAAGAMVDATRIFATGYGGSQTHLGSQVIVGQEGWFGFRFNTNASLGPYYGWMRVVFTGNVAGAVLKDWAYENTGSPIVTARVLQGAASAGAQFVTLSPGSGEFFTLGSVLANTGGNTTRLLKTSAGTASLQPGNTHTGGTTIEGGVLSVSSDSALGALTGGVALQNASSLRAAGTLTSNRALTLGVGGGVIDTNGYTITLGGTGSVTGTALTKTGSGTLVLAGSQTYTTLTTVGGTTQLLSQLGSGTAVVNANANTRFDVSQTLGALYIGAGATVTLTAATAFNGAPESFAPPPDARAVESSIVPEPGALGLFAFGWFIGFCCRPRA